MSDTTFAGWLDTFVDEKGLDPDQYFFKEGPKWGLNLIPLSAVIATAKITHPVEQRQIKDTLVRLDFANADPLGYFDFLAGKLAR